MLPRLLDTSFNEACRLHPEKVSVKINLTPLSTATMTLPEGEPTVGIRNWIELYGRYGSLGKYRVSSVKTDYGDSQTVALEHGIATLGDYLTAASTTLTGTPYAIMGTLLGCQSLWTRGTIPNTGSYTVKVDRSNVLSAVLDLLKQMTGYMLTYDFTTWTVGIALMESTPSCECRMRRNVENVRITVDDNDLCTRVYAVGLTGGYMDADTVSTWGVIAKSLGTPDDAAAADVQAYAAQYLAEYKNPRVSIEISAQDMAAKTGETIDAFGIGKLCRVALPDWSYTTDQRVVSVNYPDLLGDPNNVQLSLSTAPRDLSRTLAAMTSDLYGTSTVAGGGGGRGGGGASGKGKLVEYHTAILRNTDSVEILAWDVSDINDELITAQASITVNASNIELKVSKDGVISSINQTPESITISASRINLSGYVTASEFSSLNAALANVTSGTVQASLLYTQNLTATNTVRLGGHTCAWDSLQVCTNVHYSKEANTIPATDGLSYYVITSVRVWGDYETINFMSY